MAFNLIFSKTSHFPQKPTLTNNIDLLIRFIAPNFEIKLTFHFLLIFS